MTALSIYKRFFSYISIMTNMHIRTIFKSGLKTIICHNVIDDTRIEQKNTVITI